MGPSDPLNGPGIDYHSGRTFLVNLPLSSVSSQLLARNSVSAAARCSSSVHRQVLGFCSTAIDVDVKLTGFVPFTKRNVLRKKPERYFWFVHHYYLATRHSQDFSEQKVCKREKAFWGRWQYGRAKQLAEFRRDGGF